MAVKKKAVAAKNAVAKKKAAPAKKTAPKKKAAAPASAAAAAAGRLVPPKDGAAIRMYRIGHGDCFLLAFAGDTEGKPVYVLIDCGYKPGSPRYIHPAPAKAITAKEVTDSIREATGGHIDVAIITHEHQDHVNGITVKNFDGITIGEAWFAWTEDGTDDVANALRKKFKDKLLGLMGARSQLAAVGDQKEVDRLDEFLAYELGGDETTPFQAARANAMLGVADGGGQSMNKVSMKVFKDLAAKNRGVKFFRPHEKIVALPGAKDTRVFALGPPRDPKQIEDLDPQGDESFHSMAFGAAAQSAMADYFSSTLTAQPQAPFSPRYCIPQSNAMKDPTHGEFLTKAYGSEGSPASIPVNVGEPGTSEVAGNAEWRRIDKDWLNSADQLALAMNDQTNNASLVLAFELGKGGKVLLFAADAQRGNWASWSKKTWKDGGQTVTAKDLLSRTVLYKVGHHGSHNATLNGTAADDHANISWMGQGDHASEFTAMITAVRAWAETQNGWDHPQQAIKDALLKKACGRVFQTDTDVEKMKISGNGPGSDWGDFKKRTTGHRLYFDFVVKA